LADIRKMIGSLGLTPPEFSGDLPDRYARPQFVFNLPKRETLILISGYSVELRARIIDRWMELEAQVATKSGSVTATEVTAMLEYTAKPAARQNSL
jgi:phage regulator Rha-like protein